MGNGKQTQSNQRKSDSFNINRFWVKSLKKVKKTKTKSFNSEPVIERLRVKTYKVILFGLLVVLAKDVLTEMLKPKVISISNPSSVQADDPVSPLSGDTTLGVSEVQPQSPDDIESKLKKYFGEEWRLAYAVMMAESSGDPKRIGDTHLQMPSVGLFQINQIWHHYSTEELQNPEFNIKIAKEISSKGRGWNNWTTYRTGQYQKYL